ncbi:hypothetical protein RIF29_41843 [Crotalaria pallida]|uniref:Uncharacterized protein n=1 Tax=Crotalaria pallida TaxID=3830 RepID=A0AAN9EBD3_CROPI
MSLRHRPLHACGVSILAIGDIAFAKTQNINGPLGSSLRRVTKLGKFVTPLIFAIQYQWLAILSFMDDHILTAEKLTEKLFPPSTYLFDKIDEIVLMIMSLPQKIDSVVSILFLKIIHHVPLLEWALTRVVSWLNDLVSMLGEEDSRVEEKTIGVDRNCNEHIEDSSSNDIKSEDSIESFPPISESCEAKNVKGVDDMAVPSPKKGSYKEVLLEKGKEESLYEKQMIDDYGDKGSSYKEALVRGKEEKKVVDGNECEGDLEKKNDGDSEENESDVTCQFERSESVKDKDDPLLELFESAWLMKPRY